MSELAGVHRSLAALGSSSGILAHRFVYVSKGSRMNQQQRRAARATFLAELQAGRPWREATAVAGLALSRTSVYRLRKRAAHSPESALSDGRHGHVHKLHPPIRDWIVATCHADPHLPSHRLQAAIDATFSVTISIRYLNQVRAALGVRFVRPKKTTS
jgi:transposase